MGKDTILLAADTSSPRFSIALLEGTRLIAEIRPQQVNRHSSDLIPRIEGLLLENSYSVTDIDAFCVGLGPGSFTGLRVGLTTMRGLAMSLKKPIVGIPSIDAIANSLSGRKGQICVIIDAKQKKVYARIYKGIGSRIVPKGRISLFKAEELMARITEPTIFLGDGVDVYRKYIVYILSIGAEFAPEPFWHVRAAIVGRLGVERLCSGKRDNVFSLSPLYIYPKECQVRKQK
ncbi:MAG: tRNA (adenosine(37)-N6)-threonylcarbamoyltransferase complex dimerization subunit type 1 TsaB [Candidatus Omnitrophica bacterium]|nr:tRNA (adenosine(37)-N6)-threonylcarbamoyltransferase complex dimerization subunit type 1 TsaB [Candidatus Omnitrophota bacterium]